MSTVRRVVSPPAADAGIAAGVALVSLAGGLVAPVAHVAVTGLLVAMSLVLAVRRRFPGAVLAVTVALTALLAVLGDPVEGTFIPVLIASYTAAVHGGSRVARALLILAPAVLLGLGIPQGLGAGGWAAAHLPVRPLLAAAGMCLAGLAIRKQFADRARHAAVLAERTQLIAAQQEERARGAALAERVRIAREMHDIVAHHLSVVVIQAQGAQRVAGKDPARAKSAMADVERTGRTALEEMRHLLGLLRSGEPGECAAPAGAGPDAALEPPFGLGDLEDLAAGMRTAGLPVTIVQRGPDREVPEDAGLTVYRVVQESLTNVLKHAGAAAATVELDFAAGLAVTVTDDGRGASAALDAVPGSGRGTTGMRERVAALGGRLVSGPRPGGGYLVRATIPLGRS